MVDKVLTVEQVAEVLRVHKDTVYGWLRTEKIHGFKVGGVWRVSQAELDRLLAGKE